MQGQENGLRKKGVGAREDASQRLRERTAITGRSERVSEAATSAIASVRECRKRKTATQNQLQGKDEEESNGENKGKRRKGT